jgi:hypothetical protein
MKQAIVMGVVAGVTAALVLILASLLIFLAVGRGSHHEVELGPDGQPTYTVPAHTVPAHTVP